VEALKKAGFQGGFGEYKRRRMRCNAPGATLEGGGSSTSTAVWVAGEDNTREGRVRSCKVS